MTNIFSIKEVIDKALERDDQYLHNGLSMELREMTNIFSIPREGREYES